MKNIKIAIAILTIVTIGACQKFDRPELVVIPDPPKVPTNLKSYWAFENSIVDSGENKLVGTPTGVTYVAGVSGQAMQGSATANLLVSAVGDTIRNLGSYTVSMWVNSASVANATGLLAVSNSKQFWGNLEIFYEGYTTDATTAFLKVHMYNKNVAVVADQEAWNEYKIPNWFGKWSHLVITYAASTSTFKIFANGVNVYTSVIKNGTYGPIGFNDVSGMVIGTFAFMTTPTLASHGAETWARNFTGQMDQLRIYNIALSDAEINTLFTTKK